MKRLLFIIMLTLVLNGIVIAAKSEPNSPSIKKQDAKGIATAAKSEPNRPSVKKEGAKGIAAAAKSEPNKPSVEKEGAKEIAAAAKSEPNRPGIEEQDVKQLITSLARGREFSRVIEEGTKQLLRTDLKSEDKAYIRLEMAKSYEAMPLCGRLAKEKYSEILEMHPDYNQNVEIAVRLAGLNTSIIMDGTTRNLQQAIDCYRYAIERSADQNRPEHGMQSATLTAHIGLGYLCLDQHEYEEARKHFEAVYNCEPEMMSIVPDESENMRHPKHPVDIAEKKAWVLKWLESAKTSVPRDIVLTCLRSDPEESLVALRTLMKAYASDPNVSAIAQSFYEQETARKESLMKQAGTH
jgi:hypothetical protein